MPIRTYNRRLYPNLEIRSNRISSFWKFEVIEFPASGPIRPNWTTFVGQRSKGDEMSPSNNPHIPEKIQGDFMI